MEIVGPFKGREAEEKRREEKRRKCLVLIQGFLRENNLFPVLKALEAMEPILSTLKLCDNVDLCKVIEEFESYHDLRFDRKPKIYTRIENPIILKAQSKKKIKERERAAINTYNLAKSLKPLGEDELIIKALEPSEQGSIQRELPPLCEFPKCTPEWLEMAQIIAKEIVQKSFQICWDDVIGHASTKDLLQEALIYPSKFPKLFSTPLLEPCRGMLLHGPPGTGKTMIAKAVAAECECTFFNVSSALIISKWRGESEKMLKVLFEMAQFYSPSIIYFDEVDALASRRGHDHESSRRLKSELLVHLDGIMSSPRNIFFLAATNLPWDLDESLLRRLDKKMLIDLPNNNEREEMLRKFLPHQIIEKPRLETDLNYVPLALHMEGYSGSDIWAVCKETARQAVRCLFTNDQDIVLAKIKNEQVMEAISKVKSTVTDSKKYQFWQFKHGSI